ncbi:MAG: cytochrome c peroxidase [Bacteroidota bacterium]
MRQKIGFIGMMIGLIGMLMLACQPSVTPVGPDLTPYELNLPPQFPQPESPPENALTQQRVALGRALFYDPILSRDSTISCASCHLLTEGLADHNPVSVGIHGRKGFRNAPTLLNVAYHPYFFVEGGSPSLELQVLGPVENEDEMGFNGAELDQRVRHHPVYGPWAERAYGRQMGIYVVVRALAAFERTLISGDSPWDRYMRGDSAAMSPAAQRGWQLFTSDRLQCRGCHSGLNFSDYSFRSNGLYADSPDAGRHRITLDSADLGTFKVPSLRQVALTWPYMHDGSLPTLAVVIDHYDQGGKGHPNQDPRIQPLGLQPQEKADLLAFLQALTDTSVAKRADWMKP